MKRLASFLLFTSLFCAALPTYAATTTTYQYMRLWYYRDGDLAKADLLAHPTGIDILAPQIYKIADDGSLSGTIDPDVLAFTKAHGIKVMPLVTNGGFSRAASEAFLGDPMKEQTAINAMLAEAHDRGYWGYQFDFEQMGAADKALYTNFIDKAALALHAHGLKVSVAVIAKVSDNPGDYGPGLWDNLIGVYDYTALANAVDFLSIMSYDDPESTQGPAPWPWWQRVFLYTLARVPNNKISMGIPDYYWQRDNMTEKILQIGGNEGIDNVFANHPSGIVAEYDPLLKERSVTYTTLGQPYTLWYEDQQAVAARVGVVTDNHLYGVSLWVLGLEIPGVWNALAK